MLLPCADDTIHRSHVHRKDTADLSFCGHRQRKDSPGTPLRHADGLYPKAHRPADQDICPEDQGRVEEIYNAFLNPREYLSLGRREDIVQINTVEITEIEEVELDLSKLKVQIKEFSSPFTGKQQKYYFFNFYFFSGDIDNIFIPTLKYS